MKVDAKELWQSIKNVSIFSREKGWAGGATKFSTNALRELSLATSDDFVGIRSKVELNDLGGREEFYLSHKSLKELEKWLRDKDGEVEVKMALEECIGFYFEGDTGHTPPDSWREIDTIECPDPEWWGMFDNLMMDAGKHVENLPPWAFDPARLSKMNLLEPKAEYPLALAGCIIEGYGDYFVAFKYGPNTQGVLSPLRMDALKEAYGDKIDEVVW